MPGAGYGGNVNITVIQQDLDIIGTSQDKDIFDVLVW